jgi:hypothetical protein
MRIRLGYFAARSSARIAPEGISARQAAFEICKAALVHIYDTYACTHVCLCRKMLSAGIRLVGRLIYPARRFLVHVCVHFIDG